MAGSRTYGWTADGGAVVDREAKVLILAASDLWGYGPERRGRKSMKQVVRELNDAATPTVTGAQWSPSVLKRMLVHPRMIGRKADKLGRVVVRGPKVHAAIFDTPELEQLWYDLRAELLKSVRVPRQVALLTDYIKCGRCGAVMYAGWPRGRKPRYACHPDNGCGLVSIVLSSAADYVGEQITARADTDVTCPYTSEQVMTWWAAANVDAQRALVAALVVAVIVHPAATDRPGGRMEITWRDAPAWPEGIDGS